MKKLFLLFAAGLVAAPSFAQYNTTGSVVLSHQTLPDQGRQHATTKKIQHSAIKAEANRGTVVKSAWFAYDDAKYADGLSAASIYPMYQDSTILSTAGTPPFFWYIHGLGASFDPTSRAYNVEASNAAGQVDFTVASTDAYTVDSIEVVGQYDRKSYNNYVDTLIIDVVATGTNGTYSLKYISDPYFAPMTADSAPSFRTAIYDNVNNKMSDSVTSVIRIVKVLNAAAFADTTASGLNDFKFSLGSLAVPAGAGIVAVARFKSGHTYPFAHPLDSTNMWNHYCLEPNGTDTWPTQNVGDKTAGLIMTTQSRYQQPSFYSGHRIYPTTFLYDQTAGFDYPYFGFHVICSTCAGVGVKNVSTAVVGNAFPNPANDAISLPITMKQAGSVNVSMTNLVGQTMSTQNLGSVAAGQSKTATFSTSGIANGVYFLVVEANGARTAARFVVAH